MRVFITGGAGFIGSHLADHYVNAGHEVSLLDNFSTGSQTNIAHLAGTVKTIDGDIRNIELIDQLTKDADLVLHMAAALGVNTILESPLESMSTNITGSEVVLLAAAKYNKRIIIASTSEIYGKNPKQPLSETDDRVVGAPQKIRWTYSDAKAIEEAMAFALHQERKLAVTTVRLFNTVGPRQTGRYGMVVPRFVQAALNNEPITIYGDGNQSRVFCHVADAVQAISTIAQTDSTIGDVYNVGGAISGLEINGPFEAGAAGDTPSRRAIFSCYPTAAAEERACAQSLLSRLATQAYRRPVAIDSGETSTLLQFYDKGRQEADFETGIQYALARLLIDPRFLYQAEAEPAGLAPGTSYAITDLELATRLSFFLWSSIPDQQLLDAAVAGRLHVPAELEAQTRRMLRDPKARALVDNFAAQWLRLRELDIALPLDSAFNSKLRRAFRSETELLFTDVIAQDLGLLHLFNADYTWLNEDLANHYGIADIRGDYMRRVPLPADSPRRGLLGHGSILTATSVANRTSPVIRGAWVVEHLLGAPVPTPPPGVETDLSNETAPEGRTFNTLRERLELHRENPTCASCHQIMDPIGLAMENFDLVGRWRTEENGHLLNTHTQMVDGTAIDGPVLLRQALRQAWPRWWARRRRCSCRGT